MQLFINNWLYSLTGPFALDSVTLPISNEALARLGLSSGDECTLTLAPSLSPQSADETEIIKITGSSEGGYTITRGMEGTLAKEWAQGSQIFAALTAGMMQSLGGGSGPSDSGWITLESLSVFPYPPEARLINGIVYLRGDRTIPGQFYGQPIAQLPVGWAPGKSLSVWIVDTVAEQGFTVSTDGVISVNTPYFVEPLDPGYLNFDAHSFPVG